MPSAASFGARPGRSPLACFRQCRQPTTRIRLLSVPARNLVSARAGLHPPAVAAQQEYLTARCLSRRAWHQARLYLFQRESRCLRTQHRFDCAKCKHAKCKQRERTCRVAGAGRPTCPHTHTHTYTHTHTHTHTHTLHLVNFVGNDKQRKPGGHIQTHAESLKPQKMTHPEQWGRKEGRAQGTRQISLRHERAYWLVSRRART